jgi:hypothetical protein
VTGAAACRPESSRPTSRTTGSTPALLPA